MAPPLAVPCFKTLDFVMVFFPIFPKLDRYTVYLIHVNRQHALNTPSFVFDILTFGIQQSVRVSMRIVIGRKERNWKQNHKVTPLISQLECKNKLKNLSTISTSPQRVQ